MEERQSDAAGGDLLTINPRPDDDFRSCCGDEEEWEDTEESFTAGIAAEELDETSVRLFFKGVSTSDDEGKKLSGIGVVMERAPGVPVLRVQKKLDFFVDELVAEHLALMDGLLVALQHGIKKIFAFTNSEKLYFQIAEAEILEDQLLVALGHRILELVDKLEDFDLILLPSFELERPLKLAKEAIGIKHVSPYSVATCPLCREERRGSQMVKVGCSHTFCYSCLTAYVEEKLMHASRQLPIRCPQPRCKYHISAGECKSFLPVCSYESLERAFAADMERFYCPFPNCSVLLDLSQHFLRASSSSGQSDLNCVECPECHGDICVNCGVPWHIMMGCDEYQSLPIEDRDAGDLSSLHRLAQNNRWRRCHECRRMIELTQGCFHMTCWCGHEFCYSCGAEYNRGVQTCQCVFWDDDEHATAAADPSRSAAQSCQASEMWAWDTFDCMPTAVEGYSEQERAQLALIQRFLAGGFSLGGGGDHHHPSQSQSSPPRCGAADSYVVDTIKDLHQLPWLERFVSVISDTYNDEYIQ